LRSKTRCSPSRLSPRRRASGSCACWWLPDAEGLAAGAIAEKVASSPSNVSFHLKELERAGLVVARRESRSIIYAADYAALSGLVVFLMENCCAGQPEICGPVVAALACAPASQMKDAQTKERTC
jgi:ArsR family transcriptional regulator, arsenate/arsenite/antimonite-responsive transcriptional repressor